jgi:hypothetical protein
MKVTITIEDDGEGGIEWGGAADAPSGAGGPYIRGPYIRGPYIRGPHIVIPREDGSETEIDIAGLAKAAEERAPEA